MPTISQDQTAYVSQIFRYPMKGLDGTILDHTSLAPGGTIPWDRAFAIANGESNFDPENPTFLPKTKFLNLARNEKLASLRSSFDADSGMLTILRDDKPVARGNVLERIGRQMLEQFFAAYMQNDLHGAPHILHGVHHSFSDIPTKCVSLINLASIREIERVVGKQVDPQRFRGNIYIEGLQPWEELGWENREIRIGDTVILSGLERIGRCTATNVDPLSAKRDLNIPQSLTRAFGHMDCGLYAEIVEGGGIATGQAITVT